MFKKVSDYLTALRFYLHQTHLSAKDYQEHLLSDRILTPLNEDIDRIKELAIGVGESLDIASAVESLRGALDILSPLPETNSITEMWRNILKLEEDTVKAIKEVISYLDSGKDKNLLNVFDGFVASEGLKNALGDISEKRIRDIYLINIRLKGGGNNA